MKKTLQKNQQKKKQKSFRKQKLPSENYQDYNQISEEFISKDSIRIIYNGNQASEKHKTQQFIPKQYAEELKQLLIGQFDLLENQKKFLLEEVENKLKEIKRIAFFKAKATKVDGMFVGIWIGISICMFLVLMITISIFNLSIKDDSRFSRDFPTWRGIAIFIWYVWILGLNMWLYQKYKLSHRKIFRFAQDHYPQAVNIFKFAAFHTTVFLGLFLLYVFAQGNIYKLQLFELEYFALACWVIFFVSLILPFPIFSHKGRFYAFKLFFESLLSPFMGVNYTHLWMFDQLISMVIPLKDMSYTYCYYTQGNFESTTNSCKESNRAIPILVLGVFACSYKIFQSLKLGYDNKKYLFTPPFYHTIKLIFIVGATVLAYQYTTIGDESYFNLWLLMAIISTLYSYLCDIILDWGLLQENKRNPYLRKNLVLPYRKIYWFVIVLNLFMRMVWILTLSPVISNFFGNINLFNLLVGVIQILRKGIWNFFRLQNQHFVRQQQNSKALTTNQSQFLNKKQKIKINYQRLQYKLIKFYQKFRQNLDLNQDHPFQQPTNTLTLPKKSSTSPNIPNPHNNLDRLTKLIDIQQIKQISQLMDQAYQLNPWLKIKISQIQKRQSFNKSETSLMREYL